MLTKVLLRKYENVGAGWLFIPDVSIFRQGDLHSNDEDACSRQPRGWRPGAHCSHSGGFYGFVVKHSTVLAHSMSHEIYIWFCFTPIISFLISSRVTPLVGTGAMKWFARVPVKWHSGIWVKSNWFQITTKHNKAGWIFHHGCTTDTWKHVSHMSGLTSALWLSMKPETATHERAMAWKYFPYYWLIVRRTINHWWIPLTKDYQCGTMMFSLLLVKTNFVSLNNLLNEELQYATPWHSCSICIMNISILHA